MTINFSEYYIGCIAKKVTNLNIINLLFIRTLSVVKLDMVNGQIRIIETLIMMTYLFNIGENFIY